MSKEKSVPAVPGEFKLDAKDFKTGNLLADIAVSKLVDFLNKMDLNKDGKKDMVQLYPLFCKILPLVIVLLQYIDWEKVKQSAFNSQYINKFKRTEFQTTFEKLVPEVEAVVELAPKELPVPPVA
jgi:hypothetical protein